MTAGRKDDHQKAPWDLFLWGAASAVVDVLEHGRRKYDADNWRAVPEARRRYFAAALRHLVAWRRGEALDPESGLSHLGHAATCILFLLELEVGLGPTSAEMDEEPDELYEQLTQQRPSSTVVGVDDLGRVHHSPAAVGTPDGGDWHVPSVADTSRAPWNEAELLEHGFKAFNWERGIVMDIKTGVYLCVLGAPEPVDFKKVREDWNQKQREKTS